jgi:hypothetical protein
VRVPSCAFDSFDLEHRMILIPRRRAAQDTAKLLELKSLPWRRFEISATRDRTLAFLRESTVTSY